MIVLTTKMPLGDEAWEELAAEHALAFWAIERHGAHGEAFLVGYFQSDDVADEQLQLLQKLVPEMEPPVRSEIADTEWRDAYKAYLKPYKIGRLHWIPVWDLDKIKIADGEVAVTIDAGMAFGTGSHETTRLCARAMLAVADQLGNTLKDKIMLDVGCGSGILAISARKLGFGQVSGFDNDPEAIRVSVENAQQNNVDIAFKIDDIACLPPQAADCICANIQADVLGQHATTLCKAIANDGVLVLSGILSMESQNVENVFKTTWNRIFGHEPKLQYLADGEWVALILCQKT